MTILPAMDQRDGLTVPIVVIGAGGCGLCAGLAAQETGTEVLVIERDPTPLGSTGMSTGLIPAAGTPEQRAAGIEDDAALFAADILSKAPDADPLIVGRLARESADTVAWLQSHQVPLTLVDGFVYAGHSVRRMFGTPNRTGSELVAALERAAVGAGVTLMTSATVESLFVDAGRRVTGVRLSRPDGSTEDVGCDSVILASCGFGGNQDLLRKWIPEISDAVYHGHPGNRGEALQWGEQLDAAVADLSAYQGHGNLAAGHGIVINWPSIIEGGIQANLAGERFYDESIGYSAAAAIVNRQSGQIAWTIFDERIARSLEQFDDYRAARQAGAIVEAADITELVAKTRLPPALIKTLANTSEAARGLVEDRFGRDFTRSPPLSPPYRAVRVTGALFHTQGGLVVDADARVLDTHGDPLPNLFAGGGAARGISGAGCEGYIAGNGLLTATGLGKLSGRAAAALLTQSIGARQG